VKQGVLWKTGGPAGVQHTISADKENRRFKELHLGIVKEGKNEYSKECYKSETHLRRILSIKILWKDFYLYCSILFRNI